jgi:hypothetical protein
MSAMHALRLTTSADGDAALSELEKLFDSWRRDASQAPHEPLQNDRYWSEFADAGWSRFGAMPGQAEPTGLPDMVGFAELIGRQLVAIPALTSVLALRWLPESERERAGATPCSPVLPFGRDDALLPFGDSARGIEFDGTGWRWLDKHETGDAPTDRFAPSLPIVCFRPARRVQPDPRFVLEALVLFAATTVGCADESLRRSVEYAKIRQAYGKIIGSYQAVKHMLADMYRDVELARSGVLGAAHEPQSDAIRLLEHCAELSQRVVATAIQVHGGIGFTWEAGLHFHARHILAARKLLASAIA